MTDLEFIDHCQLEKADDFTTTPDQLIQGGRQKALYTVR